MEVAFFDPRWRLALMVYRLLAPMLLVFSFVPWWRKALARGGGKSPLGERFGVYADDAEWELRGATHIHAVSVGETLIALKLLRSWRRGEEERVVLAVSTATAWVLAMEANLPRVRVVYAPVDWWPFVRSYLRRFAPQRVVLVEAEAWPELMEQCQRGGVPVTMVNARLSARSERRFRRYARMVRPMFAGLARVGVQEQGDAGRFLALGCKAEAVVVTGSVKFDPGAERELAERVDFRELLDGMRGGKPAVLAASTHDGEEVMIGEAVRQAGGFYVCVPRHAERRAEVRLGLEAAGWKVRQRSLGEVGGEADCYLVDTTGELRDWTAVAAVVVIGKSFFGIGGQNPCEAVMAGRCVVTGPHMENFQPLVASMVDAGGLVQVADGAELAQVLGVLLLDEAAQRGHAARAREVLKQHERATEKTVAGFLAGGGW